MIREERKENLNDINKNLIAYLNQVIGGTKEKIMSARDLAKLLNCSNSTVTRWLNGTSPLSIDIAIKICKILNLDILQFVDFNTLLNNNDILRERFNRLNSDNKIKVIEYIDFLLYQEQNNKKSNSPKKR